MMHLHPACLWPLCCNFHTCSTTPAPQLTYLNIQGCSRACSTMAFSNLSMLTRLRRLVARHCRLQQSAVATVARLTQLQVWPCYGALVCAWDGCVLLRSHNCCGMHFMQALDICGNTALSALDPLTSLRWQDAFCCWPTLVLLTS